MRLTKPIPFLMNPEHELWTEFIGGLILALDFSFDGKTIGGKCSAKHDRPYSRKLLKEMGADVEASLAYFETRGGFCDCEIILNVDQ